jgi:hypothetical protein
MNLRTEEIILKRESYDSLMQKASFYDAYVAGKLAFADEKIQKDKLTLWTEENAVIEIEKYYKTLFEDYKNRVRGRFTLRFWRWKLILTRK